ncbi:MAG: AtpZ/AtpI family protein [Pseudomonadota bacterium]
MQDPDRSERLKRLEAKLDELRETEQPAPHMDTHYSQAQLAWRMVIELVAGLLIGFGLGYGLDYLLGTLPIFLIILTLLGLAAGIKTMMRSAQEIQQENMAETPNGTAPTKGDEEKMNHGG